ncbi:Alpha-mannosidase 2x [Cymbomonas tetramitiformis]|uniref:Alpha-mannosidase 2x n=1 Tax=Cymbomonas tetramitiformis TaxID=36881 RepID=A0AAE0C7U2_9CHLO|nr:Alpha-mannosidase 2x [Cymbomonas tetramitiformis]
MPYLAQKCPSSRWRIAFVTALLTVAAAFPSSSSKGTASDRWSWCSLSRPCVHLIPHSHMDPGWRYPFADYYKRQGISILRGVVRALSADSRRRFVIADTAFLAQWLQDEGDATPVPTLLSGVASWREAVRQLVQDEQLDIVGGVV